MRILFLDDDPSRHDAIQRYMRDNVTLKQCTNVYDALEAMRLEHWDEVWLDHDLNDHALNRDSYGELCGVDVAKWMIKHTPDLGLPDSMKAFPTWVVVHSWNTEGAENMRAILDTKFNVSVEPFDIEVLCQDCGKPAFFEYNTRSWICLCEPKYDVD